MDGYIKLSRKFFVNPLWTEPREYSKAEAWIDLIQSAKFEAQSIILNGRVLEVQRGEVVASRRYLELRWKWSNTKVDNFLKLLSEQGMITKRNANQNTILTLSNFNTYNDGNASKNATQTPLKRHSNATQTPNIKKDNKDKKVNNTPPISPKGEVVPNEFSDNPIETAQQEVKRKKVAPKKEMILDLSFVPDRWMKIMDDWLEYRKGIKKPYKTQQGVEQFYAQLIKLSDNDGVEARKIINKAIANEWQGIGEHCKEDSNNGRKTSNNGRITNQINDIELAAAISEGAQRGFSIRRERE